MTVLTQMRMNICTNLIRRIWGSHDSRYKTVCNKQVVMMNMLPPSSGLHVSLHFFTPHSRHETLPSTTQLEAVRFCETRSPNRLQRISLQRKTLFHVTLPAPLRIVLKSPTFRDLNPTRLQGEVTNMSRQKTNRKDLRKVSNTAQWYPLMLCLTMEILTKFDVKVKV
jgi:hypothetical protein